MRTLARKRKKTQRIIPAKTTESARRSCGQSPALSAFFQLQRTIGNQTVQRLLKSSIKERDTNRGTRASEGLRGVYAGAARSRSSQSSTIRRIAQDLPYVGPLLSYLNPRNQLTRAILPGLSRRQKTLLDGIFGNSLATSLIRLNPNSIIASGHCYRTTGNIINMPGTTISDSLLIHEAAHVWQSQNTLFGVGYAVSALRAMAIAQVLGGDWQRAYDYRNVERYRIPWRYWNAEQQADWIQDHRRLPSGWMLQGALPELGVESSGIE